MGSRPVCPRTSSATVIPRNETRMASQPDSDGRPGARAAEPTDRDEWLRMRTALWPDDHRGDVDRYFSGEMPGMAVFVVPRSEGGLCGFAEWALRSFADGCTTSPVGYLEGVWVDEDARRTGVGARLVDVGREWCRAQNCTEVGSDCAIDNEPSRRFHLAQGFTEVVRAILFRSDL